MKEHFIHTAYGYCYFSYEPYPIVYGLYVNPENRRQGKSRKLLKFVIDEMREELSIEETIFIQVKPQDDSISSSNLKQYYLSLGLVILNECNESLA